MRRYLTASHDPRQVTTDNNALYFGLELNDQTLRPGKNPRITPTHYNDWLSHSAVPAHA